MSKKDKIFIIWITIFLPLVALCVIAGGIVACFNEQVGLIFLVIGACGMLLCVMTPYIIWCISGLIKLMKDED